MARLRLFSRPAPLLRRLPCGSFTVDRTGAVLASTLPQSFPPQLVREITAQVLATFRDAAAAQLPLSELVIHYASLTLTARNLSGGALVFLCPQTAFDRVP